ncbi:MAG: hypothetical protein EHM28_02400 [Spirochaetaceae bacterium]|nr:MAG: hypothetical protein EHM28_02400 [Spirochaetaceae bacterium]
MNKRGFFLTLILSLAASFTAFSQLTPYDDIKHAFDNFIEDFSMTLPALSTQGLNWSDAYIGGFPHFGAGATLGAAFIPFDSIEDAANSLNVDMAEIPEFIRTAGFPIPVWCLDGRLGGFGFPFDLGLKIGFLPPDVQLPENVTFDYLLVGADFRWGIIEDLGPIPDISVGVGLNYLGGSVGINDAVQGFHVSIPGFTTTPDTELEIGNGDFFFDWQAFTMDLKAQISKNFVFITLSAGFGATYSLYATSSIGMKSDITIDDVAITPTQISLIESLVEGLDLTGSSFVISGAANGWSLRVFGGFQFDITIFKLDINATYNLLTGSYGGSLNLRVQF